MSKNKRDSQHEPPSPPPQNSLTLLPDDLWHVYVPLTSQLANENSNTTERIVGHLGKVARG